MYLNFLYFDKEMKLINMSSNFLEITHYTFLDGTRPKDASYIGSNSDMRLCLKSCLCRGKRNIKYYCKDCVKSFCRQWNL